MLHGQPYVRPSHEGGNPEVVHCIEARIEAEKVEELELYPITNDNNRVTLVEEMTVQLLASAPDRTSIKQ